MTTKCPECGGRVQATEELAHYWSLRETCAEERQQGAADYVWENTTGDGPDFTGLRFYCENDHEFEVDAETEDALKEKL